MHLRSSTHCLRLLFTALTLPPVMPEDFETAWRGFWHILLQSLSCKHTKKEQRRENVCCLAQGRTETALLKWKKCFSTDNSRRVLQQNDRNFDTFCHKGWNPNGPNQSMSIIPLYSPAVFHRTAHFQRACSHFQPHWRDGNSMCSYFSHPESLSTNVAMFVPHVTFTSSTGLTFTIHTWVNLSPKEGHEAHSLTWCLDTRSNPAKQHRKASSE